MVRSTSKNSPEPRSSRRTQIITIVASLLGLAVVIGLVVYFTQYFVSRSDYRQAQTQTNAVIDHYNKTGVAMDGYLNTAIDAAATEEAVAAKKAEHEQTSSAYRAAIEALAAERALKDDAVRAAYDTFRAKDRAFSLGNTEKFVDTIEKARKVATSCSQQAISQLDTSDLAQLTASYDRAVNPCVEALTAMSQSEEAAVAQIGAKGTEYFAGLRQHATSMQDAYNQGDRAAFETAYKAFLDASNGIKTAIDFAPLRQAISETSPTDELNALVKALAAKVK